MIVSRITYIAALMLASSSATAAPFCVVTSYGKNCWYYSRSQCVNAAESQGGMCVINEDDVQTQKPPTTGGAPFCVVTSYGEKCSYYDANSCRRAAEAEDGACVPNSNR